MLIKKKKIIIAGFPCYVHLWVVLVLSHKIRLIIVVKITVIRMPISCRATMAFLPLIGARRRLRSWVLNPQG